MAKKKVTGEDGKTYVMKEKKPFYKKIWFWILVIIVIIVGVNMGNGDKNSAKDTSKSTSSSTTTNSKAETTTKEDDGNLKATFDSIKIGDILSNGEGGSTLDEVKATLGDPDSQSETSVEGVTAKMVTWSGVKGGDILSSVVISFSNDKAVSKAVTGLKVASHDKVTLEQFNAVATDGSFTEDQARKQFGDPDSISTTIVNGATQNDLSWTKNVKGDLGANFNITFNDGNATAKSNYGMK